MGVGGERGKFGDIVRRVLEVVSLWWDMSEEGLFMGVGGLGKRWRKSFQLRFLEGLR